MFLSSNQGQKSRMDKYSELGLKRLAAVVIASYKIQGLNDRKIQTATRSIFGVGINKDTSSKIRNARTNPEDETLQRLAPFVFKPRYFQVVGNDIIGVPIFYYSGAKYDYSTTNAVRLVRSLHDLPDQEYRCTVPDLIDILKEKTPIKRVFLETGKPKKLQFT